MPSTDAKSTIAVLQKLFSTHGLPKVIVSDNGSGFASAEFSKFLQVSGVKHVRTAPSPPASNGQAERFVRTFKESLKTLQMGDIDAKLNKLIFRYRITPHSTTGYSPSELLFNRRIRSALSQLKPAPGENLRMKQARVEVERSTRQFKVGDSVLIP